MTDQISPLVPEWGKLGITLNDSAEPEDAEVAHEASVEEVAAAMEEGN